MQTHFEVTLKVEIDSTQFKDKEALERFLVEEVVESTNGTSYNAIVVYCFIE